MEGVARMSTGPSITRDMAHMSYNIMMDVANEKEKKIVSLEFTLGEADKEIARLRGVVNGATIAFVAAAKKSSDLRVSLKHEKRLREIAEEEISRSQDSLKKLKSERDAALAEVLFTKNMLAIVTGEAQELDGQVAKLLGVE